MCMQKETDYTVRKKHKEAEQGLISYKNSVILHFIPPNFYFLDLLDLGFIVSKCSLELLSVFHLKELVWNERLASS